MQFGSESRPPIAKPRKMTRSVSLAVCETDRTILGPIWLRAYNALWYPALPFALIAGGGLRKSRERLGLVPRDSNTSDGRTPRVWLHAASVGEIEGARPVVQSLTRIRPDLELVITTMTAAGRDAARRRLNGICRLAPLDHAAAVRAFVRRVRPVLVIITETELWPNFFLQSAAAGVKIALINARVSDRSMNRYRYIQPLLAHALKNASAVLVQTAEDAQRFCALGAIPERVSVTGNAKYDTSEGSPARTILAAFARGRPILIAGSTGPGEEQIVLAGYLKLFQQFPSLALILAPRHLHRIDEVQRLLRKAGVDYVRATEFVSVGISEGPETIGSGFTTSPDNSVNPTSIPAVETGATDVSASNARAGCGWTDDQPVDNDESTPAVGAPPNYPRVLLLDTMGELRALYHCAAVAFVGGSLMAGRGGQSLAEPASWSVPVLFGPHYDNHRQLGDSLLAAGAGHVVRDAAQLAGAAATWLADEAERRAAGQRARSVIDRHAGSAAATVRYLCALLPGS